MEEFFFVLGDQVLVEFTDGLVQEHQERAELVSTKFHCIELQILPSFLNLMYNILRCVIYEPVLQIIDL